MVFNGNERTWLGTYFGIIMSQDEEVRVYQRNFILTCDNKIVPYGDWYENKHYQEKESEV